MSLGGEAGPGLEGPHVPCDGIFGLFQKACRGNNRDQEMAFFFLKIRQKSDNITLLKHTTLTPVYKVT